jgi:small subunit ribosomal protein S21
VTTRRLACDTGSGQSPQGEALQAAIWPELGWSYKVAEVIIQESESLENALRRFKRKVQQEDIIKEIKKHSFYMKPGEKRRAKEALSRKRLRKKQRREQE